MVFNMNKAFFLILAIGFTSCSVRTDSNNIAKGSSKVGDVNLARIAEDVQKTSPSKLKGVEPLELTAEEAQYSWRYPSYPEEYKVELGSRDPRNESYLSGRETYYENNTKEPTQETAVAELGSYAGPWIEGEETELLPVSNPNIPLGQAIERALGAEITPEMRPQLDESPFQAFLKLQKLERDSSGALRTLLVTLPATRPGVAQTENAQYEIQLDKEALWSLTYALYRQIEPDYTKPIATQADPSVKANGANIYGSCNMCHGADGWGRGHSGVSLQPPPANFHEPRRLFNRSETKLRQVLQQGIYGSAMPPWKDKLSDAEINHVVAYIRHFSYSLETPVMNTKPCFKGETCYKEGQP
jgi:mono/diheme cytochrome c family protein